MSLNNLAVRLAEVGRRERGPGRRPGSRRPSTGELAAANPDAYLPDLAMSLNNLATAWPRWAAAPRPWPPPRKPSTSTARWPTPTPTPTCPTSPVAEQPRRPAGRGWAAATEALAAAQEAVDLLPAAGRRQPRRLPARPRRVAEQPRHPPGRGGPPRRGPGPRRGSRRPSTGALADANPDAYLPDLAMSLNNLAELTWPRLGRREQALAPAQEAVDHYRRLADANPDAYLPDLAGR